MAYDRELFIRKLDRWAKYMENFRLPTWEQLPDMELYMDQVVSLVARYLDLIPHDEKNPFITASIINNYVRLKVMPAPVKKRYSRRHLAYVIMICAMKQSLSLTEIPGILPADMDDTETARVYNEFVNRLRVTAMVFVDQVNGIAREELRADKPQGCANLVLHSAVSSILYKILTVKLTALEPAPEEKPEDPEAEQEEPKK